MRTHTYINSYFREMMLKTKCRRGREEWIRIAVCGFGWLCSHLCVCVCSCAMNKQKFINSNEKMARAANTSPNKCFARSWRRWKKANVFGAYSPNKCNGIRKHTNSHRSLHNAHSQKEDEQKQRTHSDTDCLTTSDDATREQRVIRDDGDDDDDDEDELTYTDRLKWFKIYNYTIYASVPLCGWGCGCGSGNGSHTIDNCTPKDNIRSKKDDVLRFERH